MTIKEKIIKILEQKNINHYSKEGEIHVFPPITNELMEFLKLIKDDSFDLIGGLGVDDLRPMENITLDSDMWMHLYIRFNQLKTNNMTETFSFGEAIAFLKKGLRIARLGWNGVGIFLELQVPDEHSKMTSPYIYIDTTELNTQNQNAPKTRVPWLASQTDMLADDWYVISGAIQA